MTKLWESLAERDPIYTEVADYQTALYQLVTTQVLYENELSQVTSFRIVTKYLDHFQDQAEMLGMSVELNNDYRFIAAMPRQVRRLPSLPAMETLLLLTLWTQHHNASIKGEIEQGRAVVTVEELRLSFSGLAGGKRELPRETTELRRLLAVMKRFGVAREVEPEPGSDQPFDVAILPAIHSMVTPDVVGRLGAAYQADDIGADDAVMESSDETA